MATETETTRFGEQSMQDSIDPALRQVNAQLIHARREGYLVFAPERFIVLPRFYRVVLGQVRISPDPSQGDVYSQSPGVLALTRAALVRIADAFGVDWDWQSSGRIDDGRDQWRAEFRACARVISWDGTPKLIVGTYEVDVRAREEELRDTFERKTDDRGNRLYPTPEDVEKKVRVERIQLLKHKVARAETGAMERCIASLGVPRSYRKGTAALTKGIIVARLVVDPGDDEVAKRMVLQSALKIGTELYGLGVRNVALPPPAPEKISDAKPAPPPSPSPPAREVAPAMAVPVPPHVPPGSIEAFECLDASGQCRTLGELIHIKGYDERKIRDPKTGAYLSVKDLSPKNRSRLFAVLVKMPDRPSDDDISF
jgi:hypothetical protein